MPVTFLVATNTPIGVTYSISTSRVTNSNCRLVFRCTPRRTNPPDHRSTHTSLLAPNTTVDRLCHAPEAGSRHALRCRRRRRSSSSRLRRLPCLLRRRRVRRVLVRRHFRRPVAEVGTRAVSGRIAATRNALNPSRRTIAWCRIPSSTDPQRKDATSTSHWK